MIARTPAAESLASTMHHRLVVTAAITCFACSRCVAEPPHTATLPHPAVKPAIAKIDQVIEDGPFKAEWSSLEGYEIPQWYKDAKFGIFIHWGAYSVPAFGSEWYPRQMYIDAKRRGDNFFRHHLQQYGPQKAFGYKDFIPDFKAEKFGRSTMGQVIQSGRRPVCDSRRGTPRRFPDV